MPAPALHSFSKAIEIPTGLHDQPLDAWQTSARLTTVLDRFGIRVLGDLHGRKVVDFAWEKNCGPKTLYELDLLARRAGFQNGKASRSCQRLRAARGTDKLSPGSGGGDNEGATAKMQQDVARFAIPESIRHLSFHELPITTRLANVTRSIGARSLGDLNGRTAFELLQYRSCGWRTISEIQQLIERAASGEFDMGQIEEVTVAPELLGLLERGLAMLPLRERRFILARIGGEMGARDPRADVPWLSYAEIGRRYGLTRARVQKVSADSLDALKKIWGPRIPRLLEVIKWRCLATICPLTPELLHKWINSRAAARATRDPFMSLGLSMEAHVRLMALLDKSIPCWPGTNTKARFIDKSVRQFNRALRDVVRDAGGQISLAEAYRKFSRPREGDCRVLKVESFLRILPSVESIIVEFEDPEIPIVRLSAWTDGKIRAQVAFGKTNSHVIEFFGARTVFPERAAGSF